MMRQKQYPSEATFDANGEPIYAEDWLGNRFGIGQTVMYCIGAGRGQMMAIGTVQKMRVQQNRYAYNPQPVQPTKDTVIEVQVLTEMTSGHWDNGPRTKPAWVNEMNITAVPGLEALVARKKAEQDGAR